MATAVTAPGNPARWEGKKNLVKWVCFLIRLPLLTLIRWKVGLRIAKPMYLLASCGALMLIGLASTDPSIQPLTRSLIHYHPKTSAEQQADLPPVTSLPMKERWMLPGTPAGWWDWTQQHRDLWIAQHPR